MDYVKRHLCVSMIEGMVIYLSLASDTSEVMLLVLVCLSSWYSAIVVTAVKHFI